MPCSGRRLEALHDVHALVHQVHEMSHINIQVHLLNHPDVTAPVGGLLRLSWAILAAPKLPLHLEAECGEKARPSAGSDGLIACLAGQHLIRSESALSQPASDQVTMSASDSHLQLLAVVASEDLNYALLKLL